jgi:hypothetical protein
MEAHQKKEYVPGNGEAGISSTPLQEYDFFVAPGEGRSPEEAPEVPTIKKRKRRQVPNKSEAFFLEGSD